MAKTKEPTTAVATIQEQIAAQLALQQATAQAVRSTGSIIGFENAQLTVDGITIPANQLDVRVLAAVSERAWYPHDFDADKVQVPDCYTLNDTVPHLGARDPQADNCDDCQHNKWGSAKQGGGKACRTVARVIVVPANVPFDDVPMYTARVPITSLSTVTSFINHCALANKLTGEFVTRLSVVEDKKSFFKVHLTPIEVTNDMDMGWLFSKQDQAYELAMTPYPVIE